MLYTVPDYYRKFKCLAGDCPATCCAGWQIVIDDKSLRKYTEQEGSFGSRLMNSVDWENGTFLQYEEKRCAFLNEENLCDIHLEAGADMMCTTCRKYPRHIEVFANEREISLSMSCPMAAELILKKEEPVTFLQKEDEKEDPLDEEFDFFLYSALQDCRKFMIEILQNREESIYLRMAKILALGHDIQNRIDSRRLFEIQELLERYQKPGAGKKLAEIILKSGKKTDSLGWMEIQRSLIGMLDQLEVLDEDWAWDCKNWIHRWNAKIETEEAGLGTCAFKPIPETEMEQMAVYFLFTYFCGAVYDGDALAKVKMTIYSTLVWEAICQVSSQDRIEIARRYSRELEHSDPNLNRIEELMNTRVEVDFEILMDFLSYMAQMSCIKK
ncbi:MAG: flagellin lysine-N-methylase [Muricoprocola sp.]